MQLTHLYSWLRTCVYCRKFGGSIDYLCDRCWNRLPWQPSGHQRWIKEISHWYWLEWNSKHPLLEEFIYGLKGGGLSRTYEHLARKINWSKEYINQTEIFIPSPHIAGANDHAYALAKALAQVRKGCVVNGLRLVHQQKQRQLGQQKRWDRQMIWDESILRPKGSPTKLIFVDDVLTTGATALAAYKALNSPTSFEVWTLAYRARIDQ